VQSQQLPTESQVLEDEALPGTENADQPTEEMSERHDHGRNHIGKVRIELCAKSFILQVYDVLARHTCLELQDLPASAFYGVELKHVLDDGMCKIQPLPTSLPNSLRGHGS
jgi:hypothetical protein